MASYHPTDEKRENLARTLLREKKHLTKKSSCERDKNGPPNTQRTKKEKETEREKKIAKGHPEKAMYIVGTKHIQIGTSMCCCSLRISTCLSFDAEKFVLFTQFYRFTFCARLFVRLVYFIEHNRHQTKRRRHTHTHPTNQAFFLSSSSFFLLFPCR